MHFYDEGATLRKRLDRRVGSMVRFEAMITGGECYSLLVQDHRVVENQKNRVLVGDSDVDAFWAAFKMEAAAKRKISKSAQSELAAAEKKHKEEFAAAGRKYEQELAAVERKHKQELAEADIKHKQELWEAQAQQGPAKAKPAKRKREAAEESDEGLCVVCYSEPADHAIIPCGHLCLCSGSCKEC